MVDTRQVVKQDTPRFYGSSVMDNALAFRQKDSGGTARSILGLDASNLTKVGPQAAPASGGDLLFYANGAEAARFVPAGNLQFVDAKDVVVGTSTGTKIGTSTSQKLGFFNATPVVQPSSTTDLRTALINLGLYASGGSSPLDLNGGTLITGVAQINGTFANGTTVNPSPAAVNFSGSISQNTTGKAIVAVQPQVTPTAALGTVYGMLFIPSMQGTEGVTTNTITNINGIFSRIDATSSYDSLATTVTNFVASGISWSGGILPQNVYGFYVDVGTSGTVSNWAIYTNGTTPSRFGGSVTLDNAADLVLGTGTGTKIGTATSQKLGFYNATPIVQPSSTTDLRTALINLGLYASGGATPLDLNGGALSAGSISMTAVVTDPATAPVHLGTSILTSTTNKALIASTAAVQPTAAIDTAYGLAFFPFLYGVEGVTTNTITHWIGVFCRCDANSTYDSAATNVYNFRAAGTSWSGNIAPVNVYGLYVETITSGSTSNYAIYTNGATASFFGGMVTLDGGATFGDGDNIVVNTSTGTKIGTGTTQKLGFWNATPVVRPSAYTPSNVTTDRTYNANSTTIDELADVVGTLISDLQSVGLIG